MCSDRSGPGVAGALQGYRGATGGFALTDQGVCFNAFQGVPREREGLFRPKGYSACKLISGVHAGRGETLRAIQVAMLHALPFHHELLVHETETTQ